MQPSAAKPGPQTRAPGPTPRLVEARYDAPLDLLWIETARRCGIERVVRSATVFAAYDGAGTLTLASPETFDADDGLPQLIFHELCHALVEGPAGLAAPDWGLDNVGESDLPREWAALRVQAALAAPHGLRSVLAPTTDHRAYYDALPAAPLAPIDRDDAGDRAAIEAAAGGLSRAGEEPWASALARALRITAQVAELIAPLAPAESLWRRYRDSDPDDGSRRSSSQRAAGPGGST